MLATLNAMFMTGWPRSIPPEGALAVVLHLSSYKKPDKRNLMMAVDIKCGRCMTRQH